MANIKKERDYHRLNHRRIAAEKNRLLQDVKKLQEQLNDVQPSINKLKQRYDTVLRKHTEAVISKEKAVNKVFYMSFS